MEDNKRELTLEELKAKYEALGKKIARKEKAEAEERKIKLAAEKETRRKEVEDAFDKYIELHKAYEKDYGPYVISRNFINEFPWDRFWY